jgi:ABC-type transport system substrate-binding protein
MMTLHWFAIREDGATSARFRGTLFATIWEANSEAEGEQPHELMMEAIEYYSKAQSSMDLEEQQLWFKKVLDIAADNLWTIGILAPQTGVTVTLPNLVNYPATQAAWDMGDSGVMAAWFLETE